MTEPTLKQFIETQSDINERQRKALLACISSRGKNKGYLRSSAPKTDTDAYAAWQALMSIIAPNKFSPFGVISYIRHSEDDRMEEIFFPLESTMKVYRNILLALGTRPFQYSMWDWHHDRERWQRVAGEIMEERASEKGSNL